MKYMEAILSDLRQAGLVRSRRGADGGYWLDRPADEISVADVIRAVEGPIANVRGNAPKRSTTPRAWGSSRRYGLPPAPRCGRSSRVTTLADVARRASLRS